jgi:hypothetical protein
VAGTLKVWTISDVRKYSIGPKDNSLRDGEIGKLKDIHVQNAWERRCKKTSEYLGVLEVYPQADATFTTKPTYILSEMGRSKKISTGKRVQSKV